MGNWLVRQERGTKNLPGCDHNVRANIQRDDRNYASLINRNCNIKQMMFKPEDFELPMEKKLRMRVIADEIEKCDNVEEIKKQLVTCAESLMRYQHLLAVVLEDSLKKELDRMLPEAAKIVEDS